MAKGLFISLFLLNMIALLISIMWAINEKTYETYLALVVSLAGLITLVYSNPYTKRANKVNQGMKNISNSGEMNQAGRDINQ